MKVIIGPQGRYGGVTQHIENIENLSKNDVDIFYAYNPLSIWSINDVSHFLRLKQFKNIDPVGFFLSKCVFPGNYDIVHLHGNPHWPEVYKKGRNSKYIHTVHQIYFKEDSTDLNEWKIKNWSNRLMYKSCKESDIVISVAKWQQEKLLEEGIESIYIPNGVNFDKCQSGNAERFRNKYGINDDFMIFGGDIRCYKRPSLFIELAKRNPEKLFIMKGKGLTKDNIESKLGLIIPENLICLGLISYQDVLDATSASRVLVLTSKNETFGTVLLEAMALKKVVVGADNAGSKEVITDGKDGYLFQPDDIDDLDKMANLAWSNPDLGKNGCNKVKKQFDWKVVVKLIDKIYMMN